MWKHFYTPVNLDEFWWNHSIASNTLRGANTVFSCLVFISSKGLGNKQESSTKLRQSIQLMKTHPSDRRKYRMIQGFCSATPLMKLEVCNMCIANSEAFLRNWDTPPQLLTFAHVNSCGDLLTALKLQWLPPCKVLATCIW